jgi:hypothetical protein
MMQTCNRVVVGKVRIEVPPRRNESVSYKYEDQNYQEKRFRSTQSNQADDEISEQMFRDLASVMIPSLYALPS